MRSLIPLAVAAGVAAACESIPNETAPQPFGNEVAPTGVMRGTLVYSGPHPCSSGGHIVGAGIIFVFDRRNPPPPNGLATTPVNFAVVEGDLLFPAEPRNPGPSTYCPPKTDTITTNAPFAVSPIAGGEYIVQSFYDYTGDFLPNFTFRNLPELGDVGGGAVDTVDALKPGNAGNPNYMPHFFPIDVGTPESLPDGAIEGGIPNFTIPPQGFIADNLTVTVGSVLSTPRPYFYAGGMQVTFDPSSGTLSATEVQSSATAPTTLKGITASPETKSPSSDDDPILTIPQDISVLAAPNDAMTEANVNNFESKFPRLLLHASLPPAELPVALAQPFHFQIPLPVSADAGAPAPSMMMGSAIPTTFNVWQNAIFDTTKQAWEPQDIPEGGGVAQLWPLVVLTKLDTSTDPYGIKAQGDATHPVIVVEGITLLAGDGSGDPTKSDSLFNTATAEAFGSLFNPKSGQPVIFPQDHLTVLMRPAAICFNTLFDATNPDKRGTLVTPHLFAQTADLPPEQPTTSSIVPTTVLSSAQVKAQVKGIPTQSCLPTGRYAINIVYPDGQAWTVPNESGVCSSAEGSTNYKTLTCSAMPRPVLRSQGQRGVVEITATPDCKNTKLPAACLPVPPP